MKVCIKCAIWCLFILFYENQCLSQVSLTLEKSYKLLEEQNEDLRQANLEILLGKLDVKESKDAFYPGLTLNVGNQYNLGLSFDQVAGQLVTGDKWSSTANANVSLRTTVFQGMSRLGQVKIALAKLQSHELKKSELYQLLQLEVLSRFYEILTNIALLNTSEKQVKYAKLQLSEEEQKFKVGINTLLDVAQAENQVAESALNSIFAANSLEISLLNFKQLLGISIADSVQLVEESFDQDLSLFLKVKDKATNDPAVLFAKNEINQSELSIKYAKSAFYPSISFYSGYGTNYSSERYDYITGYYMAFGDQLIQNKSFNFGITLSMPVFEGFKTKNNITRLQLGLEIKKSMFNKIRDEREKVYELALMEYTRSLSELKLHEIQKEALEKNFNAITERYELGVSNAMEYNKAQLDLNISELNLIKSMYNCKVNYQVLKILFDANGKN
ncbi:TolC family protein [Sphingobacterium lactis]|uniref:TolC family protein n=1 Tax=Sphingobacterium lactis TaxID=797291 RepID=UPI003EC7089B